MWCRSAVSFSFLFLVTAPRMRSCACDTASRLCVRTVLCNSAFLSVPLLPSTGFAGIISESDFFAPFIIGYGLRPSRCGPGTASQGGDEDIPVPAQEVCVHAEGLKTTRGGEGPCDDGPRACCLLLATTASAPRTALLSPLNTSPVRAPVNASRTASQQCPAHDSGPMWIATPSPWWTCTTYSLPVSRRTSSLTCPARQSALPAAPATLHPI